MKQVIFSTFGQPSRVAKLIDVDQPGPPAAWEVVVDIEAFPINPGDLATLAGHYGKLPRLPAPIGMEAVGVVVECGASVDEVAHGDRVVMLANDNWTERRKVPVNAIVTTPVGVDPLQLAMLKVNPSTAALMLRHFAQLKKGEWILQTAPLSGVGRCVMQIARSQGIKTVNVVRRPEARCEVLLTGGDAVVNQGGDLADQVKAVTGGAPIRLALDAVAGSGVQQLAESLSQGGVVVNYGMLSGDPIQISPDQTIFRGVRVEGFWVSSVLNRLSLAERRELFAALGQLLASGELEVPIDSTFSLSHLSDALSHAETGARKGKVLVTVNR